MNPWIAAAIAAGAVFLFRMAGHAQAQNQAAQAGTQAGAGQTSDQGGGAFDPSQQLLPYQGGTTQPIPTVNYNPPPSGGGNPSPNQATSFFDSQFNPGTPPGTPLTTPATFNPGTAPGTPYLGPSFSFADSSSNPFHTPGNQAV